MNPLFSHIRQRLEAATPGPYHVGYPDKFIPQWEVLLSNSADDDGDLRIFASTFSPSDAALIAHAPTDLAKLLACLEDAVQALELAEEAQWDTLNELRALAVDAGWSNKEAVLSHNKLGYEATRQALARIKEESEAE